MTPNSSHFTSDLAQRRVAEVIGLPFARTTRMPHAIRPSVLPLVLAIISGA